MRRAGLADAAAVGATLAAFALRLYRLDHQSLTGDEAFSILAARGWVAGQVNLYGPGSVEPTPPLHFLALYLWTLLAGDGELAARYLSLAAGVLLVPTLYALGRAVAGRPAGLVAALLAAANPLLVLYSQTARFYAPAAWLAALAALALVRLLDAPAVLAGSADRRRQVWRLLAYVAATLLALYTHTYALLLLPGHTLVYLLWPARRPSPRLWALGQAAIAVAYLPWLLRVLGLLAAPLDVWREGGGIPLTLYRTLVGFLFARSDFPGRQALPLVALTALLFAVALLAARRPERRGGLLAAAGGAVPLGLAALLALRAPFLRDRYLIPFLPGYLLGVALGADLAGRRLPLAAALLAALALAPAALTLPSYYRTTSFASVADARALQAHLRASARPGAVVVVNLPPSDPYFQYYDPGLPTLYVPDAQPGDRAAGLPALESAVRSHAELWLIPFAYGDPANHFVERYLDGAAFRTADRWFGNIRLTRYTLAPEAGERRPADATFVQPAGRFRLAGYSLAPAAPESGEVLRLTLHWQPDGPAPRRYTVFTHLTDAAGVLWAQRDSEPVAGQRPTTGWRGGEEIADPYGLALPAGMPPGEYRLELGLYQPEDGARLRLADGQDRLVLTGVRVARPRVPPPVEALGIQRPIDRPAVAGLTLLGLNVDRPGAAAGPIALRPGEELPVTLFWRATAPLPALALELRLLDAAGRGPRLAAEPAPGYPTTEWLPGEVVRGRLKLRLPPELSPGRYELGLAVGPAPRGAGAAAFSLAVAEVAAP